MSKRRCAVSVSGITSAGIQRLTTKNVGANKREMRGGRFSVCEGVEGLAWVKMSGYGVADLVAGDGVQL